MEDVIKSNLKIFLCQIALEILFDKKYHLQDCDNLKLVWKKIKMLKDIYKKVKSDSIRINEREVWSSTVTLIKNMTIVWEMLVTF